MKHLFLLLFIASNLFVLGQSDDAGSGDASQDRPDETSLPSLPRRHNDELKQELDADAIALSKIPTDPLIQPDPLTPFLRPIDKVASSAAETLRLKSGATYTFLNQYATVTPDNVRHDQFSGRLDLTGALSVYQHGSTAGSISMLVRSGTNIGTE